MSAPKAMILAAGRGQRMGSLTATIPKPLLKVNGTPLIEHAIYKLKKSGIFEIVINVSWLGQKIIEYLGNGEKYDVKITYSIEKFGMLGTGGGIKRCLKELGNMPFWLVNADVFTSFIIDPKFRLKPKRLGHLVLVDNPNHNLKGEFSINGDLLDVSSSILPYTFSGISFLHPNIFLNVKEDTFPLEPLLYDYAGQGSLGGEHFSGDWIDVGTKERLDLINVQLQNRN